MSVELVLHFLLGLAIPLLAFLGRRYPARVGRCVFYRFGPEPRDGESRTAYSLRWAIASFVLVVILISAMVVFWMLAGEGVIDPDRHEVITAVLMLFLPILTALGAVRLVQSLVQAYRHRHDPVSAAPMIYIPVRSGGGETWHAVEAIRVAPGTYRIVSCRGPQDNSMWRFLTGDYVRCQQRSFGHGKSGLAAVERVAYRGE